jgi:hypothetical protein
LHKERSISFLQIAIVINIITLASFLFWSETQQVVLSSDWILQLIIDDNPHISAVAAMIVVAIIIVLMPSKKNKKGE